MVIMRGLWLACCELPSLLQQLFRILPVMVIAAKVVCTLPVMVTAAKVACKASLYLANLPTTSVAQQSTHTGGIFEQDIPYHHRRRFALSGVCTDRTKPIGNGMRCTRLWPSRALRSSKEREGEGAGHTSYWRAVNTVHPEEPDTIFCLTRLAYSFVWEKK